MKQIWYLLADTNGIAFRNSTAQPLLVSEDDADNFLIASLRDAAKAENANMLTSIGAGDLMVFRNKADIGRDENMLGIDLPVTGVLDEGYGVSAAKALFVVVSTTRESPATTSTIRDVVNTDVSPSEEIWIKLVEAGGAPFEGSGADTVSVQRGAHITNLRGAVKEKNANKLASIDAGDLMMFRNKADINENEKMLAGGLRVTGMGTSEDQPLFVVVPTTRKSSASAGTVRGSIVADASPSEEIWIKLVEAGGAPFEGSVADIVSVQRGALVAHVRKAIKAENDAILSHVTPAQLKVFRNKADINENEKMLAGGLRVTGMGTSEDQPLLVVVPTTRKSSASAGTGRGSIVADASPSEEIWIKLVEAGGAPFEGSVAHTVSVQRGALITYLRNKIKAENANMLVNVDAAQLKVFINKADINENEKMLAGGLRVTGMGTSEDQALFVVVPTTRKSSASANVIVGSIRLDLSSASVRAAYEKYTRVAKILKDNERVTPIVQAVNEITTTEQSKSPFIFLEGSSGMGKTQMAFTLVEAMKKEFKCVYMLATAANEQDIYRAYNYGSEILQQCVERDRAILTTIVYSTANMVRLKGYASMHLYTWGMVYALASEDCEDLRIEPRTLDETLARLAERRTKKLCFIFDEVSTIDTSGGTDYVRFIRNAIRLLKLPVVLSGTDSAAINLFNYAASSFTNAVADNWCFVFSLFPKLTLVSLGLGDAQDMPDWLVYVLLNSRPRFAAHIAERLLVSGLQASSYTVEVFQDFLTSLAEETFAGKKLFVPKLINTINIMGVGGQIKLFRNAHVASLFQLKPEPEKPEIYTTPLIHSHFAVLYGATKFIITDDRRIKDFIITDDRGIKKFGTRSTQLAGEKDLKWPPWVPSTVFPIARTDCLLHLTLLGTAKIAPFMQKVEEKVSEVTEINGVGKEKWMTVPFRYCDIQFSQQAKIAYAKCDDQNMLQPSNDGNSMEVLLSAAICAASHVGGLKGTAITTFLENVIYHTIPACVDADSIQVKYEVNLTRLFDTEMMIPFLTTPNGKWPAEILQIPNSQFGVLDRAKNKDYVDVKMHRLNEDSQQSLFGSGEAKDYDSELKLNVMKGIIERIPGESRIHIVFVQKLQGKYFEKESYDKWYQQLAVEELSHLPPEKDSQPGPAKKQKRQGTDPAKISKSVASSKTVSTQKVTHPSNSNVDDVHSVDVSNPTQNLTTAPILMKQVSVKRRGTRQRSVQQLVFARVGWDGRKITMTHIHGLPHELPINVKPGDNNCFVLLVEVPHVTHNVDNTLPESISDYDPSDASSDFSRCVADLATTLQSSAESTVDSNQPSPSVD